MMRQLLSLAAACGMVGFIVGLMLNVTHPGAWAAVIFGSLLCGALAFVAIEVLGGLKS